MKLKSDNKQSNMKWIMKNSVVVWLVAEVVGDSVGALQVRVEVACLRERCRQL